MLKNLIFKINKNLLFKMKIQFAYTKSMVTKWSIDTFIVFNEKINKHLMTYVDQGNNDKINTLYLGILYLDDRFFYRLEARKLRFSLSNKSMSIEVKIPLECIEWKEIERLIIEEIIEAIEIGIKRKHIQGNSLIEAVRSIPLV